MIPLFKTHYSIGKSILTLEDPIDDYDGTQTDSVFQICDHKELIFVEDTMSGFMVAHDYCLKNNIKFIFGVRLSVKNSATDDEDTSHKLIIFLKNTKGYPELVKLYNSAMVEHKGCIDYKSLQALYTDNFQSAVPFYDSFIFENLTSFKKCVPVFIDKPIVFIEKNKLPIDQEIEIAARSLAKKQGFETELVKSIYYNKRKDFKAWQTFKCMNRKAYGSGNTLNKPNLDHCASAEFCYESYLDYVKV